jgi:hypothetical protein
VRVTRCATPPEGEWWYGLHLATAEETLLACARILSLLDLVVLVDAANSTGACTLDGLQAFVGSGDSVPASSSPASSSPASSSPVSSSPVTADPATFGRVGGGRVGGGVSPRRPGMRSLRKAVTWADVRAESPWETLLRVMHRVTGVVVEPQAELRLSGGARVRGDLWIVGTRTLHEYDGEHHRTVDGHRDDLRRERRLLDDGWSRRGYTSVDLLHRSVHILREADDAIGRPHDPARLQPWLDLLAASLFTPQGTAAFLQRLNPTPSPGSSTGTGPT